VEYHFISFSWTAALKWDLRISRYLAASGLGLSRF